jgi:ATP-dependent RNA helicase RhlE
MEFKELGLAEELLRAIAEEGYVEPTPIQAKAIPLVLLGKDLMGAAQTGTGKTASFTLPLLHRMKAHANTSASPARHPIRALILTPTRELAVQVWESVRTYSKHLPLRSTVVYGGVDIQPQIQDLRAGVEILVATPGRLLDHVQQKTLQLGQVEFLVLDEADRMLDMGFIPDIKRILALLPARRQSLLFSATFSEDIRRLADDFMREPIMVEVARRNSVTETVTHALYRVPELRKRELLARLVLDRDLKQVLVFVRTRLGANRLANQLVRDGIDATAIHSNRTQAERTDALQAFKDGKVRVLVATDVAARGLDIDSLPCVINFELPHVPEDYVHRIGRTGRAGQSGEAISLVAPPEQELLERIEKLLKATIEERVLAGFDGEARPSAGRPPRDGGRDGSRDTSRDAGRDAAREGRREGARSDTPRPPREGTSAARPPRPAPRREEDPFFSKPYEAGTPSDKPERPAPAVSAVRGAAARPVAALFRPPVTGPKR